MDARGGEASYIGASYIISFSLCLYILHNLAFDPTVKISLSLCLDPPPVLSLAEPEGLLL